MTSPETQLTPLGGCQHTTQTITATSAAVALTVDERAHGIGLQAGTGGTLYFGGSTVTTTDFGFSLVAGEKYGIDFTLALGELFCVSSVASQKLYIFAIHNRSGQ